MKLFLHCPRCACLAATLLTGAAAAPAPHVDADLPAYQPQPYTLPPGASYVRADGAIRIIGAHGMDVAFKNLNALFARAHPEAKFSVELKGAATAIGGLYTGASAFAPNVRAFWPAEIAAFRMVFGYEPTRIKVAHGALSAVSKANPIAVFVNRRNPIERLTREQVARIFSTGGGAGDITFWGQAGAPAAWARRRIHPIGPSATNGNIQGVAVFMKQEHFDDRPFAANYEEAWSTAAVLQRVSEEPSAIGFASFDGFQGRANTELKILAIAGEADDAYVDLSTENVIARRYPFTRDIYIYVNRAPGRPLDPFVKEYLRCVLSREGQEAMTAQENGFLPLDAGEVAAEIASVERVGS